MNGEGSNRSGKGRCLFCTDELRLPKASSSASEQRLITLLSYLQILITPNDLDEVSFNVPRNCIRSLLGEPGNQFALVLAGEQ